VTSWLIDKSAYGRLGNSADAEEWATRIERGLVRVASVTLLELGFSARSGRAIREDAGRPPLALQPLEHVTPAIENRAVEVQRLLADQGKHRAVSVPDLLVAATAELARLTVLHVDKDFELIAETTGQPVERLRLDA
jgi:predicted nucleic acid-binding protein